MCHIGIRHPSYIEIRTTSCGSLRQLLWADEHRSLKIVPVGTGTDTPWTQELPGLKLTLKTASQWS